jgi:gluconate 5-dehydrogenase
LILEWFSLRGKIALVTGSSRGIGFTLARGLAGAGARVVLNGRDEKALGQSVSILQKEGLDATACPFDVRDEKGIQKQVEQIQGRIGEVDILVNNAGIQLRSPLEQFEEAVWRSILDLHVTGAFLVSKAVVPAMIRRQAGKIINICSVQSELARPGIAAYAAAKGGLKMLTRSMAAEWGRHNIQVNGIAPGYFKTDMTKALYEDPAFNLWLCNRTPAKRWGEPGELVGAAVFLASGASSYVNGHILFVDGGLSACV